MPGHRSRVTLHIRDLRASGVVRNALSIAGRLARDHEVTLAVGHADGMFDANDLPAGVMVRRLGGRRTTVPGLALALRAHVRDWRPDVVLSCGNLGHVTVMLACLGLRRPRRLYRISNAVDRPGRAPGLLRRLIARAVAADATGLLIVGEATAVSPVYAAPLATGRARIVPNGVDRAAIRAAAALPGPPLLPDDGLPTLVSVGRLHPQKDFPTLIRAAALANRVRPLRLAIVGGGDARTIAALRAIANAEGFGDRLLLPGATPRVFRWLAAADAFALSSLWEGSSMALLEAMALGLPVIATREAGDAAHVLGDGRHGLIVPAGDVAAIAAAIRRQLSDAPVRPGDRIAGYRLETTLDAYAAAVAAAANRADCPARRPINTPAPSA